MMKKTFKLASLTFLMFGCTVAGLRASEFRPSLNLERGPQCYSVVNDKDDKEAWDIDVWSIMYSRNGNKAFGKHGTKTNPLSALIFGKSEFTVSEALSQNLTSDYSEDFNANLNATKLAPRVTYDEKGVNLGASIGYRVLGGKGKLGVKFNVPVKTVRMERDNNAETNEQGFADNVVRGVVSQAFIPLDDNAMAQAPKPVQPAANSPQTMVSNMYRVSAVKDLPVVDAGQYHGLIGKNTANNNLSIAVSPYEQDRVANFGLAALGNPKYTVGDNIPFVFLYNPDPRVAPSIKNRAVLMPANVRHRFNGGVGVGELVIGADNDANRILNAILDVGSTTPMARVDTRPNFGQNPNADARFAALTELPLDGAALVPNVLYVPRGRNDAGDLAAYQALLKNYGDKLWIMTVHQSNGTLINNGLGDALTNGLLQRFASEPAERWLFRNGYTMATNQRTGLGDITVNPFYDHSFSRAWTGGVYAHLSIPTGGSRRMGENPYKARLGNDNHFELGGGVNVAWQAFDWMNVRLDAMAAYALPAKERIAIPCKDATVRNMGPTIDADIDYTRMKASLDTTFVHPRTSSLATTIGYDFEFKTKDNVSLKSKKYTFKTLADDPNSWFGGKWYNAGGGRAVAGFDSQEIDLDAAVHARNSERIAHNFRVETSWKATKELSLFWGASGVPFGQHMMKATTVYGGMSVDF